MTFERAAERVSENYYTEICDILVLQCERPYQCR